MTHGDRTLSASETFVPGTFEYIERKIRSDAKGTEFGADFEWLCQWFLINAPKYRRQLGKVWLWKEWPERWGVDTGIDLVAQALTGQLWAVQAKADAPARAIPKRELDSFLTESNRPQFHYRLIVATTDAIGTNARRAIENQEKPVGLVLRGDLLTAELHWPTQIRSTAKPLLPKRPRPHQSTAIQDVVEGFYDHDRGQLIMACGTGKTLTSLWVAEKLKSRHILVLVPSLSLVSQNLREWGRNSTTPFSYLVVCSDETIARKEQDEAIEHSSDLGVPVTTDPIVIRTFLENRDDNQLKIVFATYQSSDRIAEAQRRGTALFDLAICDEAHRCVGSVDGRFATVLDGSKIKARKRLFMTATPRYFKEHVKRRAKELDYELVSMNEEAVFGPELHVLTFDEAINADPPLLTDYQVVVIGVTDGEVRRCAEHGQLVRTSRGLETDARTLATEIGLAKAMRTYDLQRVISFHSSVKAAQRFTDESVPDSFPAVLPHLSPSSRPCGRIWSKHISGHTPAGMRATLLKHLGELPRGTRGLISNCACLGEGVDVPALDGVAFIDPKRSTVEIVRAVGRVIRKIEGKKVGTIFVPVLIDESQDADTALSQSAFDPVWQVLRALWAHDRRLADELDELRFQVGKTLSSSSRIKLPSRIKLDIPGVLLERFEQAFNVRAVVVTTPTAPLTIERILAWADEHKNRTGTWPKRTSGTIHGTHETWSGVESALRAGVRGLVKGLSLAKLLLNERDVPNHLNLPPLTIKQILIWADAHQKQTGKWPRQKSKERIPGTNETWSALNVALAEGLRGLPKGSSLRKLLQKERGIRNHLDLPQLTIQQILSFADDHKARTQEWPTKTSGSIPGASETWSSIDVALRHNRRGLGGCTSLADLLDKHRGVRNRRVLPPLTIEQILAWADEHKKRTGEWPRQKSKDKIPGTGETWSAIEQALYAGLRGLPGNSSLAKLLQAKRGARNIADLPQLTYRQILKWADEYRKRTGRWPTQSSGEIRGTAEMWRNIDYALRNGGRGLPRGSSLPRLLDLYRRSTRE